MCVKKLDHECDVRWCGEWICPGGFLLPRPLLALLVMTCHDFCFLFVLHNFNLMTDPLPECFELSWPVLAAHLFFYRQYLNSYSPLRKYQSQHQFICFCCILKIIKYIWHWSQLWSLCCPKIINNICSGFIFLGTWNKQSSICLLVKRPFSSKIKRRPICIRISQKKV